jgi:two-component system OmpR family response regulator
VVIVEDDADIRAVLAATLKVAGFRVHACSTGVAGVEAVRDVAPEVLILDVGLPDIDGFEVARRVRLFSNTYILMVTALAREADTLMGLKAGADDYITKPFRPREVRCRVEALLRRPRLRSGSTSLTDSPLAADVTAPEALSYNGLQVNPVERTVEVDGTDVQLTSSEFDILHALLRQGRRAQAKEDLVQVLRGNQAGPGVLYQDADEQVLQVHIANLRRKLGDSAADPRWVETVHGFGYRLAAANAGTMRK